MGSICRGLKAAALGAVAVMGGVMASDDDLASMKAALESMKAEMAAVKADYAASQARSQAGGNPEGLTSANGKATIRIGGTFHTTYGIGFASPFPSTVTTGLLKSDHSNYSDNASSTYAGWGLTKAELVFHIDLSCDTSGTIVLRPDGGGSLDAGGDAKTKIIDEAYWTWRNVGGSSLELNVGLKTVPFGMCGNGDVGGYDWGRVMIDDGVYVKSAGNDGDYSPIGKSFEKGNNTDFKGIGIFGKYALIENQLFLKAGVYSPNLVHNTLDSSKRDNENNIDNIGLIDHVITLAYNPCYVEGLHLEAGYNGAFNTSKSGKPHNGLSGETDTYKYSSYNPTFSLAAAYKFNEKFTLGAEAVLGVMQKFQDNYGWALSIYGDYRLTDKFSLAAGFDTAHGHAGARSAYAEDNEERNAFINIYRATVGARYDFNNGIYVKAQYFHDWASVAARTGYDATHNEDMLLIQTGYNF